MQPISQTEQPDNGTTEINGHVIQQHEFNGQKASMLMQKQQQETQNGEHEVSGEEKIVLPVEMASMVSLRSLVGKMIYKSYADLMTLTDTLPSMSDVERKRQILNYATFARKQFMKLLVLVKWAENAKDIQMSQVGFLLIKYCSIILLFGRLTCAIQNIMAFLANQNKIFQDTVDYLHKIHIELPAARVRDFDILTAVDVLSTGTYQRMPTKIQVLVLCLEIHHVINCVVTQDMIPSSPLTDQEVLDAFRKMNDVIRMRMLTSEVLPSPMKNYRIESGRIFFSVENEFNISLTLTGPSHDRRWWIVSLDVLVESTASGSISDVHVSLNEMQRQHLRMNAQKQLMPPPSPADQQQQGQLLNGGTQDNSESNGYPQKAKGPNLFFPLIDLYDYLHFFCLKMQLEIIYMQAMMLTRTKWVEQLTVQMDSTRTKLVLTYWGGGSSTAHWADPHVGREIKAVKGTGNDNDSVQSRSTMIEIFISDEDERRQGSLSPQANVAITVRDELKGLIQKAGIGASITLNDLSESDKVKVAAALKYPKRCVDVTWGGSRELYTSENLLNPSDLNVERLLLHTTRYHGESIICKFREILYSQENFLEEHGLYLEKVDLEDTISKQKLDRVLSNEGSENSQQPSLTIQYRHQRRITVSLDSRTGRVKVRELGNGTGEGDVKLRGLEERLNNDPKHIARHLLWLRSEVVIREIVSLAKQLSLQPYHPSQMNLQTDDITRLFGDLILAQNASQAFDQQLAQRQRLGARKGAVSDPITAANKSTYPSHCIFLQFSQFEDWYFVVAIVKNEFQFWLCCLNKTYEQHGLHQAITDLIHVDYTQVWKEQFTFKDNDLDIDGDDYHAKKRRHSGNNGLKQNQEIEQESIPKRRKTINGIENRNISATNTERTDNLSVNLRFMAKLDSLCRAYITNKKIEHQLRRYKGILKCRTRPFLKSLSAAEAQVMHHPAASRLEVLCIAQRDILRICAYHRADDTESSTGNARGKATETIPWVERILPHMNNEVVMRASGWWSCGPSECYVIIQDKFDCKNISLSDCEINDHISLDKSTNVLSFGYADIDTCVEQFLADWEQTFMMVNLARQVCSKWFRKYKDGLKFEPFNMKELSFTYAKVTAHLTFTGY
ncbi:mediator complex subunit [Apophysomyces ossiformis]|uniref:Mediator of RNA polymerase II transcription subunit 14 n=1 Tax=Apophysomyces ossiformis TaxID=679940 RepID=A0A8H7ET74_9FUNG|nr:mediator complex subunit [Apophysomyces ossiformis]